jgi:hypothetical protein
LTKRQKDKKTKRQKDKKTKRQKDKRQNNIKPIARIASGDKIGKINETIKKYKKWSTRKKHTFNFIIFLQNKTYMGSRVNKTAWNRWGGGTHNPF